MALETSCSLLEYIKKKFRIVYVDTEFQFDVSMSYPQRVLCFVYKDETTNNVIKDWVLDDQVVHPKFDFEKTLFVCFKAEAEVGCFLKTLQGRPPFIFDCWTEYSKFYKNRRRCRLIDAAAAYGSPCNMTQEEKDEERNIIVLRDTWTSAESTRIMNYCEQDVLMTEQVFKGLMNDFEEFKKDSKRIFGEELTNEILLDQALARGQAVACVAKAQCNGMPVDNHKLVLFNTYWNDAKEGVIENFNKQLDLWEDGKFSNKKFSNLIYKLNLQDEWPKTPQGKFKTKEEVLDLFKEDFKEIKLLSRVFNLLNRAKLAEFNVSGDGRLRPPGGFKMFGTHTGRCAPSSKWIFGSSKWARNFLKPMPGHALVYLDYKSEEPFIAAHLADDGALKDAYDTGDVYLATAKTAKTIGHNADPKDQATKDVRKVYKVLCLAIFYAMGLRSVHKKLSKFDFTYSTAAGIHRKFKELYFKTFEYLENFKTNASAIGSIHTSCGWSRFFDNQNINPRSIQNWSIQAESAEVLRNALIRLTDSHIKVCAMVHDAFLIEAPIPELEDHIRTAKQCMIDAARFIVGGTIQVDAEVHLSNYKQEEEDQKIFDSIFEEIKKAEKNKMWSGKVSKCGQGY